MKLNDQIKDWEIAKGIFGKNTQKECKIVKDLRKAIFSEEICEGWWELKTQKQVDADESGYFIPVEYLK